MTILRIENKRWLTPWRCVFIGLSSALITACFVWSAPSQHSKLASDKEQVHIRTPSLLSYPNVVDNAAKTTESVEVSPMPKHADSVIADSTADLPYIPAHGMDALGRYGAWDGRDEAGNRPSDVVKVDAQGRACISTTNLTTEQLRTIVPPDDEEDNCHYRLSFRNRDDRPPSEILATDLSYGPEQIYAFLKNGRWTISDFEKMNIKSLSGTARLSVYLLLSHAGSPQAAKLRALKDGEETQIKEYIEKGSCPTGRFDDLTGPYCLLPDRN